MQTNVITVFQLLTKIINEISHLLSETYKINLDLDFATSDKMPSIIIKLWESSFDSSCKEYAQHELRSIYQKWKVGPKILTWSQNIRLNRFECYLKLILIYHTRTGTWDWKE